MNMKQKPTLGAFVRENRGQIERDIKSLHARYSHLELPLVASAYYSKLADNVCPKEIKVLSSALVFAERQANEQLRKIQKPLAEPIQS